MKKMTGVVLSLFCVEALPMCSESGQSSPTILRDGPPPACEDVPPECVPDPPECEPPPPACGECEGGVVELTLRYIEGVAAAIVIEAGDDVYDLGVVAPGGEFTIEGTRADGRFDSNNLEVALDGVVQAQEIHVSCSQPIEPGTVFGALQVVGAVSRENGPVCPAPECLWCGIEDDKADRVGSLAFRYTGPGATVTIHDGNGISGDQLFGGAIVDGDLIEIDANDIGKTKLKSSISFYDDNEDQLLSIHTSCSQPLVPGVEYSTAVGDFELVAGADENEAPLCPLLAQCEECGFGSADATGVTSMEIVYNGPPGFVAFTNLANPLPLFAGDVVDGDVIVLNADAVGDPALGPAVNVYSTNLWIWVGFFMADCTAPLGPGSTVGMGGFQLTMTGGEALGGAGLCPYDAG